MRFLSLLMVVISATAMQAQSPWYHGTTVYQIYPRSFYDTDGDGIGDLQGIINKLDYIKATGFETIWISPFFLSPQQDHGYDISDYYAIAPEYGTLELAQQLIEEVHQRDMKVLFDMVLNHTSIQHPWFQESRQDSTNPRADWYVWQNGDGNGKPNNWKSQIGGSAWHYDSLRGQYFYSAFLPFQPDLNYHNPEVKAAMFEVVRYWLDQGVDGFRLDLFNSVMENPNFPDNPFAWRLVTKDDEGFFQKMENTLNYSQTYIFAEELRNVMDEFNDPQRFLLGEVFGTYAQIKEYQGDGHNRLHLAFLFDMLDFDFEADYFRQKVLAREAYFPDPYMPVYAFSNHDRKRSISRMDNDVAKAKVLAAFQLTVRGVPVVYMGEEIGMTQATIPLDEGQDPLAIRYNWIPQFMANLSAESLNRDECRTPMQWSNEPLAGFTTGDQTWLPVQSNYTHINVQQSMADSNSLWQHFHTLLSLRQQYPALHQGDLQVITQNIPDDVLAYTRTAGNQTLTIYLNFSKKPQNIATILGDSEVVYGVNLLDGGVLGGYGVMITKP